MHNLYFELQEHLKPALRAGDLASCETTVAQKLTTLTLSPFHCILDLSITNSPTEVAAHFDAFFRRELSRFQIKAAYTETNGFDINPDRWFFDLFAYKSYGGHDDYDWLSDWQSDYYSDMTIAGLEPLQAVYASDAFQDKQFRDACDLAGMLVILKFQDLIRRASSYMRELYFPLLATAHDSDFIYEIRRET